MRRASTILLLFAVLGFVCAAGWDWTGGATGWWTYWLSDGKKLMQEAFKSCKEYKNGAKDATGSACMFNVALFVFESAVSTVLGGIVVDAIKQSGSTETKGSKPPRSLMARMESDEAMRGLVLQRFNDELNTDGLLATHIVPSHIHPEDGFAIRMNVHNDDDSTLHIHTNGTSAMALFDEHTMLEERDILPTNGNHYKFSGISGIFFQAHLINKPPSGDWKSDLNGFLQHFVRSNLLKNPIMSQHDKWKIQVCNKKKTATFWYGKLEAKENGFSKVYESITPSGCK